LPSSSSADVPENADDEDALAVRDGVALFVGPGGVPVILDHEGVSQVIGDLAERA